MRLFGYYRNPLYSLRACAVISPSLCLNIEAPILRHGSRLRISLASGRDFQSSCTHAEVNILCTRLPKITCSGFVVIISHYLGGLTLKTTT